MEARKDYAYFLIRLTFDAATIMASWFLAYYLRFFVIPGGIGEPFWLFTRLSFLVLALCLFFLNRNRLYSTRHYTSWLEEIQLIFYSSLQSFLGVVVFLYFFYPVKVSRVSIAVYFVIVTLFLILERITIKNIMGTVLLRRNMSKKVLLVGHGGILKQFIKASKKSPDNGTVILGQYDGEKDALPDCRQYNGSLLALIELLKPDTIVIGYPKDEHKREKEMMKLCYDLLQTVILIPNLPFSYIGTQIMEYHRLPVIYLNHISLSSFQKVGKRVFDFTLSLIGVMALSPLLLIVALLVKLTSPGPIFYRQTRITEHGRAFTMLKFRSMACTGSSNNRWTVRNDPRVTRFGKFIRCSSLDELPQLFNVLKGDMSLIGPRPERPELVDKFIQEIPGYQLRHKVKAGVSGWAQVNGWRGNTSLARRIECDLFYIRNWSFSLDIKIIVMTFFRGFVNKNAY